MKKGKKRNMNNIPVGTKKNFFSHRKLFVPIKLKTTICFRMMKKNERKPTE